MRQPSDALVWCAEGHGFTQYIPRADDSMGLDWGPVYDLPRATPMKVNRNAMITALVVATAGLAAASFLRVNEYRHAAIPAPTSETLLVGDTSGLISGDSREIDSANVPTEEATREAQPSTIEGPEESRERFRLAGRREAFTPEEAKAFREQRREQRQALQAERRELAKNSPEVATERLAKRLRLTDEQTVALAEINQRYAEQLRELDDFNGTADELAVALRQADSQRLQAIVPIVQESPALVEPMERFMARAAKAGAVPVQPGQTQTPQD